MQVVLLVGAVLAGLLAAVLGAAGLLALVFRVMARLR